jgi:hypothetical protein
MEDEVMQNAKRAIPTSMGRRSMSKRNLMIAAAMVVVAIGWYLFRPELIFVSRSINESFPNAVAQQATAATPAPTVLSMGQFHGVAHDAKGMATLYQLPDGKRVLRFTEFETSNGPDVQVYLVAASDANDNETVTKAGFIHLGALKGNVGDQNYTVPVDIDLSKYQAVTIWCRRFGVNFGTAPLQRS